MGSETIKAIVAREAEGIVRASLETLSVEELPEEDVLVQVAYSTLNYKDGLAVSGKGKICRRFPMVCGIDLAGTVLESASPDFRAGDRVLVNGYGLSERYWGGYAQQQRLKPEWLIPVPEAFSFEEAMAIGTAGYTAMLCVLAIQDHSVTTGPIVVTGATGGVGSVALLLLKTLGYETVGVTGKSSGAEFLERLGAGVMHRDELAREAKPLESERWAGGVDTVGSSTLATVLAQTRYGGIVTACGLAGGTDLPTTVMPFILRGVTLRGVDSVMAPRDHRLRAWESLGELLDPDTLKGIYRVEPMSSLPNLAEDILSGAISGRVVIDANA